MFGIYNVSLFFLDLPSMNPNKELPRASEWYANRPALRAMIASVTPIGTFVDTYFSTWGQIHASKRIENALEQLNIQINSLINKKEFSEYLNSEDFFDLLIAYFERSIKTKCQKKVRAYANIVMNSIINSAQSVINDDVEYENIDFIQMIYELNSFELAIMHILIKNESLNTNQSEKFEAGEQIQSTIDIIINEKTSLKRNTVLSALNKLESIGLLSSYDLGFSLGKREKSFFDLTDLFRQLKMYLIDFTDTESTYPSHKEEL